MSLKQALERTAFLERLIDEQGFNGLTKSETLATLYFWRHGHFGPNDWSVRERSALARALNVDIKTTYVVLAGLVKAGVVWKIQDTGGVAYVLNPEWTPAWETAQRGG